MREWSPHSYEKISILSDYLQQFAVAAQRAPNRAYLDAFAGDTVNVLRGSDQQFPGSPELALGVTPQFTHVRLFEKQRARADSLRALAAAHTGRSIEVVEGDCNARMAGALAQTPVEAPTFAFLDPEGMELHWSTIRLIADHKRAYAERTGRSKVEMWILFSSAGIVRMLGSNRSYAEQQGFPETIARLYGAWGPWQAVWEARLDHRISPGDAKKAYLFLYMDRLAELGYRHLLVRPIKTSRNDPSTRWCSRPTASPGSGSCNGRRRATASGPIRSGSSTWPSGAPPTRTSTAGGATTSRSTCRPGWRSDDQEDR